MPSQRAYLVLVAVTLMSAIAYFFARSGDLLQVLAALPLVGSLLGLVVKVLLDAAAHDRAAIQADAQNRFILGVSSHMGNIAFDKHVEFCEEYVREAQAALVTLIREGPAKEVLQHGWALNAVRQKFAIWLTADLELALDPFEATLRSIGAQAGYIDALSGTGNSALSGTENHAEARGRALEKMYNEFAKVMGFKEWNGKQLSDELAVSALVRKLRGILGTEELVALRAQILTQATAKLKN